MNVAIAFIIIACCVVMLPFVLVLIPALISLVILTCVKVCLSVTGLFRREEP